MLAIPTSNITVTCTCNSAQHYPWNRSAIYHEPASAATAAWKVTKGKVKAERVYCGVHRYKDLVDDEDHERLTRVLTTLEKKDEMQQRMEAITKSVLFLRLQYTVHPTYILGMFTYTYACMALICMLAQMVPQADQS